MADEAEQGALPGKRLEEWRSKFWPPVGMRQVDQLPIYVGERDDVAAYAETLSEALLSAADHIYDKCRGKPPRWMKIPKVHMDVERMNITTAQAKASKKFTDLDDLTRRCGTFDGATLSLAREWLANHRRAYLVAHRPFNDLRAYLFWESRGEPERVRFYESGLVISPAEAFLIQDQRAVQRRKRRDTLRESFGISDANWTVFGRIAPDSPES
jgi:hypothetical protein